MVMVICPRYASTLTPRFSLKSDTRKEVSPRTSGPRYSKSFSQMGLYMIGGLSNTGMNNISDDFEF